MSEVTPVEFRGCHLIPLYYLLSFSFASPIALSVSSSFLPADPFF